ncbi:uncharacterized protein PGTG_09895 [Puccinia graminis f. sp. tritici CRL 75-36-700-3]|uniref:Uncharacterized protein n=1 Tax=Puccinia graminis f. sp. tritici (strain CRL 75-36-700-3 / race SCCL) TaxID=418459 RepID=E3KFA0_PUCGT|nr:uncharacterized protein PGTG_09895 [Puccinia graminis f. sp. tritici CRL 75-36-700-3]EFP82927.1 hypothetical protein PGTG_09895 [Puccinia graminis f. sp. tritici CRL 75-36-700-3]
MDTPPSPHIKSEYFTSTTPTTTPPSKLILLDSNLKLSLESNPKRSSMSSTKDSDVSGHPTLKLTGVEQLKPPGSDSNYLDWSWILEIHFAATDVDYIINDKPELAKARATFDRDKKAVCGVISCTQASLPSLIICNIKVQNHELHHTFSTRTKLVFSMKKI